MDETNIPTVCGFKKGIIAEGPVFNPSVREITNLAQNLTKNDTFEEEN